MKPHHPLKVWRFSNHQTQADVAKAVRAQVSRISELECGRVMPSLGLARRLAEYTGLTLDEVLKVVK